MRALLDLEKTIRQLQDMAYVKSVDGDDTILVVLKGDLKSSPQQMALLKKKLSEKLGKNIKLVEDSYDIGKFIEQLVAPARVIAMNKIWLPDNSMEMRIILDSEKHLKLSIPFLQEVLKVVKGIPLRVDFERRIPTRTVKKQKRLSVDVQSGEGRDKS